MLSNISSNPIAGGVRPTKTASAKPETDATPANSDAFVSTTPGPTYIHPDSMGKIRHLAFQLDHGIPENVQSQVFGAWGQVFTHIDEDVKVTIAVEDKSDTTKIQKFVEELGIKNPDRFKFVVTEDLNITMWARDQMLGMGNQGGGNTLVGQTTMRPHGDDELLVPRLAEAMPELHWDPDKRLQTDGGDEVSNPSHTFLGYNSLLLTAKRFYDADQAAAGTTRLKTSSPELKLPGRESSAAEIRDGRAHSTGKPTRTRLTKGDELFPRQEAYMDKALKFFEEKYDNKVVVLGADDPTTPIQERPATFHVDMGTTPIDRNQVLVGDPSAALAIINSMTPEERASHNLSLNNALGLPADHDSLGDLVAENTVNTPDLQHQFDDNARIIGKEGFEIGRLPYLQGPPGMTWVTYNNCLMESYQKEDGTQVRRVFLPEYGLPKLDQAAEEVYKARGFEVVPLQLSALTAMRGAIRCISNVYDREVPAG